MAVVVPPIQWGEWVAEYGTDIVWCESLPGPLTHVLVEGVNMYCYTLRYKDRYRGSSTIIDLVIRMEDGISDVSRAAAREVAHKEWEKFVRCVMGVQ